MPLTVQDVSALAQETNEFFDRGRGFSNIIHREPLATREERSAYVNVRQETMGEKIERDRQQGKEFSSFERGKWLRTENTVGLGMCSEGAWVAQYLIESGPLANQVGAMWSVRTPAHEFGAHEFLLVAPEDFDLPQTRELSVAKFAEGQSDFRGLYVVDPWLNIGCKAKNYAALARETVERWGAWKLIDSGRRDEVRDGEEIYGNEIVSTSPINEDPRSLYIGNARSVYIENARSLHLEEERSASNNQAWVVAMCTAPIVLQKVSMQAPSQKRGSRTKNIFRAVTRRLG